MLSWTDRCGKRAHVLEDHARPAGARAARDAPAPATRRPPISMVPASGVSRPASRRRTVVLPQPDGPSTVSISPGRTSRSTPIDGDDVAEDAGARPWIRTAGRSSRAPGAVIAGLLGAQQEGDGRDGQRPAAPPPAPPPARRSRSSPHPRSRSPGCRSRSGARSRASGSSLTTVRKTSAAPARKAGRRNGTVSRTKARTGPSPRVRPASSSRGPARGQRRPQRHRPPGAGSGRA